MPQFHFITGLPRAGSTLLAAILRQNPRFVAGMTSPVGSLVQSVLTQVSAGSEFGGLLSNEQRRRLLKGLFESFYADVPADSVVFDTNRMWSARLPILLDLFPQAKAIACVRNVAWVMDSIERMYRANPYETTRMFGPNSATSTVYSRLEGLAHRDQLVGFAWSALREACAGEQARSLMLLDYDALAQSPRKVMQAVYDFIGEPVFDHDFDHVEYDAPGFDAMVGAPGLHKVKPKVQATARQPVIPLDLFRKYEKLTFWTEPGTTVARVVVPAARAASGPAAA